MSGKRKFRIVVLPGDGIGPEVVSSALLVCNLVAGKLKIVIESKEMKVGGISIDETGQPITEEVLKEAKKANAVLLGAVGGPKWEKLEHSKKPEQGLLALRKGLKLFANLRPVKAVESLINSSSIKPEVVRNTDLVVVRELTGGIYFGKPRGIKKCAGGMKGVNTEVYTEGEIERIARVAFDIAMKRRKKVTSVDKANVLESSQLWRDVVNRVHKDFPDIEVNHMYVDNCAMQLIRHPGQFDVILTNNLFGDILSDEAAMLSGSIGMLPSASIGNRNGLYEPIHGSAPDIAGRDIANPLATILSVAMMFRYSLNRPDGADAIEKAVANVLEKGYRTPDIAMDGTKNVGTREMAEAVMAELNSLVSP